jgi:hypothetical protein
MAENNQKFATEIIELPSNGWLYPDGHLLRSGQVELKYPTAADEDILTSKNLIQKGIVLEKFIESIFIGDKSVLKDMLLGDYDKVLMAARILAYGKIYDTQVICPECGYHNKCSIDTMQWEHKKMKEEDYTIGKNEFTFTLPISKKKLTFKLLTVEDDRNISIELKRKKKIFGANSVQPEMTSRYKYMIIAIDGNEDRRKISDFVDRDFMIKDSTKFKEYLTGIAPSVITNYDFICGECGYDDVVEVPLDANFFWPTKHKEQ